MVWSPRPVCRSVSSWAKRFRSPTHSDRTGGQEDLVTIINADTGPYSGVWTVLPPVEITDASAVYQVELDATCLGASGEYFEIRAGKAPEINALAVPVIARTKVLDIDKWKSYSNLFHVDSPRRILRGGPLSFGCGPKQSCSTRHPYLALAGRGIDSRCRDSSCRSLHFRPRSHRQPPLPLAGETYRWHTHRPGSYGKGCRQVFGMRREGGSRGRPGEEVTLTVHSASGRA